MIPTVSRGGASSDLVDEVHLGLKEVFHSHVLDIETKIYCCNITFDLSATLLLQFMYRLIFLSYL